MTRTVWGRERKKKKEREIGFWVGERWKFHINQLICFAAGEEMEAAAPATGACGKGIGKRELEKLKSQVWGFCWGGNKHLFFFFLH